MNHPGSGGSTGPPRLARVAPAALATYDRMQHQASGRPVAVASLPQSEILAAVGHAAAGARAAWTVAAIANRAPHLRDMDLSARHGPAPPPQGGRSTPRRS